MKMQKSLRWIEITRSVEICVTVIFWLVVGAISALSAQEFWRDEVNTIVIARAPFSESWHLARYDAMPQIFFQYLRGIERIFFWTDYQTAMRCAGYFIWCMLLFSVLKVGRLMWNISPTWCMSALMLSPYVVRYSETLRPYGMASFLAIWLCWALWNYVKEKSTRAVVILLLVSWLNVHTHLLNVLLLVTLTIGGVACSGRNWRRVAPGLICNVLFSTGSLFVYAEMLGQMRRVSDIAGLTYRPLPTADIARLLGNGNPFACYWWYVVMAVALLGICIAKRPVEGSPSMKIYTIFSGAGGLLAVCMFGYLNRISSPWYYLPAVVLATFLTTGYFQSSIGTVKLVRPSALVVILVAAGISVVPLVHKIQQPQTTAGSISRYLKKNCGQNDIVVVSPWYYAVTMRYYLSPEVGITSVPPKMDNLIHRQDQYMADIDNPNAMKPIVDSIRKTFREGGRVWFAGHLAGAHIRVSDGNSWAAKRTRAESRWAQELTKVLEEFNLQYIPVDDIPQSFGYENIDLTLIQLR